MRNHFRKSILAVAAIGLVMGLGSPSISLAQSKPKMAKATKAKASPQIMAIQNSLKKAGYDPGPADGIMGKKTRAAVKAFQKANGLKTSGRIDKTTRAKLMGK